MKTTFVNRQLTITRIVVFAVGSLLVLFISGCRQVTRPAATQVISTQSSTTTRLPSSTATATITVSPSSTPSPSTTPSPTTTPTSTATPHPMSIVAARQRDYPASTITIEQTLEPGANYFRYYAGYQSEGLHIYGLLTVPFGEAPPSGWPAIVFNHGYIAPAAYQTTQRYIAYVDQLTRAGYVVFKIDYRGHDQSQGEATGAYGDPGYTTDVLNALSALQASPLVDADRIGMWGHSMGGFLTLRAMVISHDIKAGVIWSGVVGSYADMLCCWHHPAPRIPSLSPDPDYHVSWRDQWIAVFGAPEVNPQFWDLLSANAYLADLSGPVQFSQDLYQDVMAIQGHVPVEYYEYPGDDHNIASYFNLAMQRTIEFFDTYLKGGG
jgi:dienelactone hydrolase